MTDEQIEQLAQRIAKIILDQLHEGLLRYRKETDCQQGIL